MDNKPTGILSRAECLKRFGSKGFWTSRNAATMKDAAMDFRMDNLKLATVELRQMRAMFFAFDEALQKYGSELLTVGNMERHNIYKLFGGIARLNNVKFHELLALWNEWFYFSVEHPTAKQDEVNGAKLSNENPT